MAKQRVMHIISSEESRGMLVLQKEVLQKVSFDQQLFYKELRKTKQWLLVDDLKIFVDWVLTTFSTMFSDLADKVKEWFSDILSEETILPVEESILAVSVD